MPEETTSSAGATQPHRRTTTSTVEDYLKCVLVHQGADESAPVSMGALSAALGVAPGTVTAMMKTLAASDLVLYEPYSGVRLTETGRRLATHVVRRHRLIELFLVEIMELDWSEVHPEAELLEHAVSDGLVDRMDEMLGFPTVDPHGDPIPSSDGLVEEQRHPNLTECDTGRDLSIARVLDQSPTFLRTLEKSGMVIGAAIRVVDRSEAADAVEVAVVDRDEHATLGFRAAAKVVVQAGTKSDHRPGRER